METRDFLVMAYDVFGGTIRGKTKLQKMLYFLAVKLDIEDDLGYRAHYYGPYSSEIEEANEDLKSLGLVVESVAGWGAVDRLGFEVARHDFSLTADGKRVAQEKEKLCPENWKKIEKAAEGIAGVGGLDYMQLSIAAKTFFLVSKNVKPSKREDLVALARRFGWSICPDEIGKAVDFLSGVRLVTLTDESKK